MRCSSPCAAPGCQHAPCAPAVVSMGLRWFAPSFYTVGRTRSSSSPRMLLASIHQGPASDHVRCADLAYRSESNIPRIRAQIYELCGLMITPAKSKEIFISPPGQQHACRCANCVAFNNVPPRSKQSAARTFLYIILYNLAGTASILRGIGEQLPCSRCSFSSREPLNILQSIVELDTVKSGAARSRCSVLCDCASGSRIMTCCIAPS
jgi:hypothetical protein